MTVSFLCNDLSQTESLAKRFADRIRENGAFVCLFGDVGAGKTAFTKFVCKYLNVKEKVTSPSFVILNEYKSGDIPVYHFDLYRLEKEGINTIINELDEYSAGRIVTFVEWAEFSENSLPFERINVNINYVDDTKREFIFEAFGDNNKEIINGLKNENTLI